MEGYTWSVIFSVLAGIGAGVALAYSNPEVFVNSVRTKLVIGLVILFLPFTIYFSISKVPLITHLMYFGPVFLLVWAYVANLIVEQYVEKDLVRIKNLRNQTQVENELEELLAERKRRQRAREYSEHVEPLSDLDLDERIRELKRKNYS